MKDIKVLLFSSKLPPEYAGSGLRILNTYARLIDKYKIKAEVVCGSEEFSYDSCYRIGKMKIRRLNSKIIPYKSIVDEKNRLFKKIKLNIKVLYECIRVLFKLPFYKYDIVHIVGKNYITTAGVFLAYIFRKPLIIEYVNCDKPWEFTFSHEPGLFKGIVRDKPYRAKNTILIALSPLIERHLKKYGFDNIWVRPNPVDENRFRYHSREEQLTLRLKLTSFSEKDIVLCYIGKWRPSKNHFFLLELMKLLPQEFKLIVGGPLVNDGPYFQRDKQLVLEVEKFIKENSLEERVVLLRSFVENVPEYMALSDMYLMPTETEALGTPLLEAIAVGRPVVANNLQEVWGRFSKDFGSVFLTPLQKEKWIENVYQALGVKSDVLKGFSEKILNMASSGIIDAKYHLVLKELEARKAYQYIISLVNNQ